MPLPAKLPHPPRYCRDENMTEKDWEEYFANREKYDKPVSEEEQVELILKARTLLDDKYQKEFNEICSKIPMQPAWALAVKDVNGFKMISDWNLYEAKQAFPDEF